jgi:hypothetical protein
MSNLTAGQITDEVLHDLLLAGAFAAKIFVKNPQHQQQAGNLISAIAQVMQVIDPQLTGQPSIQPSSQPAS